MTDNEIRKQLERFMAGQTSLDEERRLAEYFRTHDVPEEWNDYKRMFAWFDEGMPFTGKQAEKPDSKRGARQYAKWLWCAMAAAAVAALLIIMEWPKGVQDGTAGIAPPQIAHKTSTPTTTTDSLEADTTIVSRPQTKRRKPRMRRDTYKIMPPKTYLADRRDSVTEAESLLAEQKINEILQQQEDSLMKLEEQYRCMDIGIDIYTIALENYDFEEEEEYY